MERQDGERRAERQPDAAEGQGKPAGPDPQRGDAVEAEGLDALDPVEALARSREEKEPPPGRRLLAFAALFLGLITLSQANFAPAQPLIAPPVLMAIVLLAAAAGLLVWIDARWSRSLLWVATGIAMVGAAAAALLHRPPAWLAGILLASGVVALFGAAVVAVSLVRPRLPFGRMVPGSRWAVILAGLLLLLATVRLPGPALALTTAGAALVIIYLLRPAEAAK